LWCDQVDVVHEPIEHGIGKLRIADLAVPLGYRKLPRDLQRKHVKENSIGSTA